VKSAIEGAIDFDVHSAPDVFGRSVTDIEAAPLVRRAVGARPLALSIARTFSLSAKTYSNKMDRIKLRNV